MSRPTTFNPLAEILQRLTHVVDAAADGFADRQRKVAAQGGGKRKGKSKEPGCTPCAAAARADAARDLVERSKLF